MRYLQPEYQNPDANIQDLLVEADTAAQEEARKPSFLAEQSRAVRQGQALREAARPIQAKQVASLQER